MEPGKMTVWKPDYGGLRPRRRTQNTEQGTRATRRTKSVRQTRSCEGSGRRAGLLYEKRGRRKREKGHADGAERGEGKKQTGETEKDAYGAEAVLSRQDRSVWPYWYGTDRFVAEQARVTLADRQAPRARLPAPFLARRRRRQHSGGRGAGGRRRDLDPCHTAAERAHLPADSCREEGCARPRAVAPS